MKLFEGLAENLKNTAKDKLKDILSDGVKIKHDVAPDTKNIIFIVIGVVVLFIFMKKR